MLVAMKVHPSPSKQGKYPCSMFCCSPRERSSRLLYGSGGLNLATLVDSRISMAVVERTGADTLVCETAQDSQQQQVKGSARQRAFGRGDSVGVHSLLVIIRHPYC